jgi:hypothetical protein
VLILVLGWEMVQLTQNRVEVVLLSNVAAPLSFGMVAMGIEHPSGIVAVGVELLPSKILCYCAGCQLLRVLDMISKSRRKMLYDPLP